MRRGQHNSGLTGGPINGTKLPEPMIEVIVAPTVVEFSVAELTAPANEQLAALGPPSEADLHPQLFVMVPKLPPPSPPRVVKPVKPKIRPKRK